MERPKDITIFKRNHSLVAIQCDETITKELSNYFSAYAPNYMWSPMYKNKVWDGKIRFFTYQNELPIGLVDKLYEFAERGKYTIECTYDRFTNITKEEFAKFVSTMNITDKDGNTMEPRPYQLECAYQCIRKKTLSVEAATSAGKSLIIYMVIRFMVYMKLKTLLVCSGTGLVEQMFSDFKSYGWKAEKYCHKVYAGQAKYFDAPVTIVCWNSMVTTKVKKINPYENFDCLIIDEAHGAKAKSLSDLAKVCINAEFRFGFSGTYPDPSFADWYTVVGSLGHIENFATYKFLQENNYIAQLKIYNVILNYDRDFKINLYNEFEKNYAGQNNIIHSNVNRNKLITKLVQNLDENVLVLFTKKEQHGYILRDYFERELKDKLVFYIDGDTPVNDREDIRVMMEGQNNIVLLGSYGCVSTGISIKNLGSVVFASGYKSRIKTLQSIGRSLRLHKDKSYAKLFDIVDDASFIDRTNKIKFINYSMKHYDERKKFYEAEEWNVTSVRYQL